MPGLVQITNQRGRWGRMGGCEGGNIQLVTRGVTFVEEKAVEIPAVSGTHSANSTTQQPQPATPTPPPHITPTSPRGTFFGCLRGSRKARRLPSSSH